MGTLSQKDYEDYLKEFHQMVDSQMEREDSPNENCQEENEQGYQDELDIAWLREVGLECLIDGSINDDPCNEEEEYMVEGVMSTLTPSQARAVQRRVNQAQASIGRRKNRLPDVRDVFPAINEAGNDSQNYPISLADNQIPCDGFTHVWTPKQVAFNANQATSLRQTSVDDARLVFRSEPEEIKKKSTWIEKSAFANWVSHKSSGYKLGMSPPNISVPGTGVEVLSYNVRGSMKRFMEPSLERRSSSTEFLSTNNKMEQGHSLHREQNYSFQGLVDIVTPDELPDLTILNDDPLGVTYPWDLSKNDQKKIYALAQIELTSLFDSYGFAFNKRKATKRKLKDGVFRVSLEVLCEEDQKKYPNCQTPVIFQKLLREVEKRALKEEGILRKPAGCQAAEALKEFVDENYHGSPKEVDAALSKASPHDLANLVKYFIRELPEPLLGNAYIDAYLQVLAFPNVNEQVKVLNLLVMLLKDVHRETLRVLLRFLEQVSLEEESNRMNIHGLSVIMAPNLFPPSTLGKSGHLPNNLSKADINAEIALATSSAIVTKMLIKYREVLWMVPPYLLRQYRNQNEELTHNKANKENKSRKMLSRKHKDNSSKPRSNSDSSPLQNVVSSSVSESQANVVSKKTFTIQLECDRWRNITLPIDSNTSVETYLHSVIETAGGCGNQRRSRAPSLEEFQQQTSATPLGSELFVGNHSLFELGGNIGERRVPATALVKALMRNNPFAEWRVKCNSFGLL